MPLTLSRCEVKVHAAPSARPAQAAVASALTRVGEQARVAVPVGPLLQVPAMVPPSSWPGSVQASSAARPVQASMATCGGLCTRKHTSVSLPVRVPHAPVNVSPSRSVPVHESPFALPAQASTSAWGGDGGLGAQATVLPSTVARQVPVTVVPPSVALSEQESLTALPLQASIWTCAGAQMRVPDAEVSATIALDSAEAVVEDERTSLDWLQANTIVIVVTANAEAVATTDLRVVFGESFVMPDGTEARAIKFLGAPSLE